MSASPYKFLDYYDFTEQDVRLFFGRDRESQVLLSDILVARLVVLFAETGTGKTSLINAGVRPRLAERGYVTFLIRVRQDPAASARAGLCSLPDVPELRGDRLDDQLTNLVEDLGKPIVIFFDQFEEFFISYFRENRVQAQTFIEDIARLYENEEAGVHIVFSLREDWFVEMDHFRDEIPTIFHNDSNLRLRWFDQEQARDAIRGPAASFGVAVEPRLIDRVTRDLFLKDRGIEPAQLQIVCDTLWKHHTGSLISFEDYRTLSQEKGRVNIAKQILDQHFENIFNTIETDNQLSLLERLLPLLRTERDTKYGRDFDDLVEKLKTDAASLNELLEHLERAQLIRKSRREGLTIIELAHDYLAPRVIDLQERVQAIALHRLLKNARQRAKERRDSLAKEREQGGAAEFQPSPGDIEAHYLSPAEFDAVSKGAKVLGELSQGEADFLFEAALERGTDLQFWFQKAEENGVKVWQVLEQKIIDPEALIEQAENAVRLLGMLETDPAMKLLETALQQDALAQRAVDVLGDLKSNAAFELLLEAVRRRKVAGPVIDKLSEIRSAEAVKALESFLQEQDLAQQAALGLERLSRSRDPYVATRAKEVLDHWRAIENKIRRTPSETIQHVPYEIRPAPRRAWITATTTGRLAESNWAVLLRRIAQGRCTPLLGPGLSEGTMPLGPALAQVLAKEYGYPLDNSDDLSSVAQFIATAYDSRYLKERLCERLTGVSLPNFADPNEPHRILASLPLPIFLTTNYDDSMVQALRRALKDPVLEICRWNRLLSNQKSRFDSMYRPTIANPVVYHLWGHVTVAESLVVTEDDRLDFIVNTSAERDLVPLVIQEALVNSSLLFLGYRTSDPDIHFLLRNLFLRLDRNFAKSHVAVQLLVVGDPASEERVLKSQEYFERYFGDLNFQVYWGSARDFLQDLNERWSSEYSRNL
jgi:hypothetical protein